MSIQININQPDGNKTIINMTKPFIISKLKEHIHLKLNIDPATQIIYKKGVKPPLAFSEIFIDLSIKKQLSSLFKT